MQLEPQINIKDFWALIGLVLILCYSMWSIWCNSLQNSMPIKAKTDKAKRKMYQMQE